VRRRVLPEGVHVGANLSAVLTSARTGLVQGVLQGVQRQVGFCLEFHPAFSARKIVLEMSQGHVVEQLAVRGETVAAHITLQDLENIHQID